MSRTPEQNARVFSILVVLAGAGLSAQAISTLVVAFIDGAITADPLMLLAFLLPPVAQAALGATCIVLGAKRRFTRAALTLVIGVVLIDVIQATGLVIVWAQYVPEALDIPSFVAAYVPLSEFILVGPDWYGGVGYATGGIAWGVLFWACIAISVIAVRRVRRGTLPS
jgi:hypothetical protein